MAYGHAEPTPATIRLLEAETRELLARQEYLAPELAEWLREAAESASGGCAPAAPRGLRTTSLVSGNQGRGTTARSVQIF
jgi:hypothetical protein